MELMWSSNIGDYGEYWDDIHDVHGHWWDAEEDPENAEYTIEQLEETRFEVPTFIEWLFQYQNKGWSIDAVKLRKEHIFDPSEDVRYTNEPKIEVVRVDVKCSKQNISP